MKENARRFPFLVCRENKIERERKNFHKWFIGVSSQAKKLSQLSKWFGRFYSMYIMNYRKMPTNYRVCNVKSFIMWSNTFSADTYVESFRFSSPLLPFSSPFFYFLSFFFSSLSSFKSNITFNDFSIRGSLNNNRV